MTQRPLPIAVLISGGGTTLHNLIARIGAGRLPVAIRLVISSKPTAGGLAVRPDAGIPTRWCRDKQFDSDEAFGARDFRHACAPRTWRIVVMAGFLKFVPIPADFANRVVNIHPALIPAFCGHGFYGHHVHEAVLEYGAKLTGCTVHFVDNQYDHGPIILQRTVPVLDDDTPDTLAARVFEAETEALPDALALLAAGRVQMDGRRVTVLP